MAYAIRPPLQGHEAQRPTVRPRGVGVIVAIDAIMGVLSVLGGLGSLASGGLPSAGGLGFLQTLAPVLPLLMIGIGALQLAQAFGLWRGLAWAWTLAVTFQVVHIIADVGFVADRNFALDKFIGLAIIVGSLVYLTRPGVRAYFGKFDTPPDGLAAAA